MSRFINLEFSDESNEQFQSGGKTLVKDEPYYLAEARAAFEVGNFEQGLRFYSKVLEFNPKNSTAWTGQVRMLIELGEFREAKFWADKALERFPNEPELLAAKAVALGRSGDLQGALAFSDASIEERGDTPYVWLARGDVLLARSERRADYCFEKALLLSPCDWFTLLARGAHPDLLRTIHSRAQVDPAGGGVELRPFSAVARTGTLPAGARPGRGGGKFLQAGASIESPQPGSGQGAESNFPNRQGGAAAWKTPGDFPTMTMENLNRLLSAVNDYDASDLHLVAGMPPAFRVNGEIIIADEDALTEEEIDAMAGSLMNEQQRKKFEQEWELCISILHSAAGRVRATFYRRNNHTELSFRFCGEKVATREELGLPEKIDDLARKPNGLVLITGPTGAGKTTTLNYLVDLINSERRCKIVTIEDPIEFVHKNKRAIVVQQEVLTDVRSFNRALDPCFAAGSRCDRRRRDARPRGHLHRADGGGNRPSRAGHDALAECLARVGTHHRRL
jgi:hypothetical protein